MAIKDFKTELNELFKGGYERVIFPDDDDGMNEDYIYRNGFKRNINKVCYINCEFCLPYGDDVDKVNLHSSYNYWGSVKLCNLLEKYEYNLEWDDYCIAYVYRPDVYYKIYERGT
jgi:hypothetical protein